MSIRLSWPTGLALILSPAVAAAQLCTGAASFTAGSFQVFGNAAFSDNGKSFGGGLAIGNSGPFGQVSVNTTSYDGLDQNSLTIGAAAGYQVRLDAKGTAHLCPLAGVSYTSGPNDIDFFGDGSLVIDRHETDIAFGIGFGILAISGPTQIIPNVSLSFVNASVKAEDQVSGESASNSESFGILGLGVGFVVSRVVTLHPGINVPIGLDGADVTFAAGIGVTFGKAAR